MLPRLSITIAIFALLAQIVLAATPPACLLRAVNTQDSPGDLKAVCGNADTVKNHINEECNSNYKEAMSAFSSVCSGAGVSIATSAVDSSSIKSSATGTSSSDSSTGTASNSASTSATEPTSASHSGTDTRSTTAAPSGSQDTASSGAATSSAAKTGAAGRIDGSGLAFGAFAMAGAVMAI